MALREIFVHLAYLDDSGTKDKKSDVVVMSAVIVEGWEFRDVELAMGAMVETLVPPEKVDDFEEFHAWELFGGLGPFEDVDQDKRFGVIRGFLNIVAAHKIPIVYGAVSLKSLAEKQYGSADPLDMCFRACIQGIDVWASARIMKPLRDPSIDEQDAHPLVVLIADDFSGQIKATLTRSFRGFRNRVRPPTYTPGRLWYLHDALYFGNSKDSVGIQLADICGHIIRRHLQDNDDSGFYEIIKDRISFGQFDPRPGK